MLRSALVYATKLKQRRERYEGGIKALADQMSAIITSHGATDRGGAEPGNENRGDIAMKTRDPIQ